MYGECQFCWYFPSYSQGLGYGGVPFAGHAFSEEVGGSIIHVTLEVFPGSHKQVLYTVSIGGVVITGKVMLYMLAFGGTAQSPWP